MAATKTQLAFEEFRTVPTDSVYESKTNPRRHFDEKPLGELAASVKVHGVLVPLLVRHKPATGDLAWEIIAGARRFRAASAAGLGAIPVRVVKLTDTQVLEVQVIENLQREDVHPLEEALGYKALMAQARYDVSAIAAKVGKSESYVYQRLKLTELVEEAQRDFLDNRITAGHAVQIARLQPAKQREALEACFEPEFWQGPCTILVSVRKLRDWIQEHAGADLGRAPFALDDAELVPAAGPCTTCPRASGVNRNLFDDDSKEKACYDEPCFNRKVDAHIARQAAAGLVAISDSWQVKDAPAGIPNRKDYEEIYEPEPGEDEPEEPEATCAFAEMAIVAHGYRRGETRKICRNPECPVHGHAIARNQPDHSEKWERERKAREEKQKLQLDARRRALRCLLDLDWSTAVDDDLAWWLIQHFTSRYVSADKLAEIDKQFHFRPDVKGGKKKETPQEILARLRKAAESWDGDGNRQKLVVLLMLLDHLERSECDRGEDVLADMAESQNIYLKNLEKLIRDEQKNGGKKSSTAKPAPAAAAEAKRTKTGKAGKKSSTLQASAKKKSKPGTCRVCGCTDYDCRGCIERTGEPCTWIEPDLCSACEGEVL